MSGTVNVDPMTEHERALANARTAWSIEGWPARYFAWKELALEMAAFLLSDESLPARQQTEEKP